MTFPTALVVCADCCFSVKNTLRKCELSGSVCVYLDLVVMLIKERY